MFRGCILFATVCAPLLFAVAHHAAQAKACDAGTTRSLAELAEPSSYLRPIDSHQKAIDRARELGLVEKLQTYEFKPGNWSIRTVHHERSRLWVVIAETEHIIPSVTCTMVLNDDGGVLKTPDERSIVCRSNK